jgi:hypothetical protein
VIMIRYVDTGNRPTPQGGLSKTMRALEQENAERLAAVAKRLRKPKALDADAASTNRESNNGPK